MIKDFIVVVTGFTGSAGLEQGGVYKIFKEYGEKIIAAASLAFAVWRWWKYREAILYKRLVEYIDESDKNLAPASRAAIEAIMRPSRPVVLPQPAYALEMKRILARNSWGGNVFERLLGLISIENTARWKLGRELASVRKRHIAARKAENSLRTQQAQIHLVAGAISAAKARKTGKQRVFGRHDAIALREFRKVLQIPGHQRDVLAKENEAFQLLRLGRHDAAMAAYVELEGFAADVKDARDRDTILARAKRYRAQILQLGAGVAGNAGARGLLAPPANQPDAICALTLRAPYQPYENWDLIEQAETHYLTALVAHRLDNVQIEAAQKALCQQAYQTALEQLPKRNFWLSRSARLLKQEVKAGLLRVGFAAEGKYDDEWLGVR